MSFRRFLLAALSLAAVANAASSACSDVQINSDGDATSNTCTTVKSLTVGNDVTNLELDHLQEITGDMTIKGATGLKTINLPQLQTIGGSMTLLSLTVLATFSCPNLVSVDEISWTTLPLLSQLSFTKAITNASSVTISDTNLQSLTGINLMTAETFNINNNKFLKSVDVQLTKVSGALTLSANAKGVNCSFSNLKSAANLTIGDAGQLTLPKLENVTNSLAFDANTFETLELPKLSSVGDFSMSNNNQLTNVTATELKTCDGTFLLANNTALKIVDSFEALTSVTGAVDMSGVFTNVSLPSLDDVRGGFNLQSTNDVSDSCNAFTTAHNNQIIKGNDFTCKGKQSVAETKNGGDGTTGGSGDNSTDGKGKSGAGKPTFSTLAALVVVGLTVMAL